MTTTFFGLAKCYTFYLYRLFVYRLGNILSYMVQCSYHEGQKC